MRLVLAVLLILTSPVALAIEVQGEGKTLEQALNNAFKVAIDIEVGVILDTERHLKNGKITHNQILSYSAGYITTYTILHHIHIRDIDIHQVSVNATVASSKLKNFLLSSNNNSQSFNVDNIKTQIKLYKEGYVDRDKLVENTLKYFPQDAFNIVTHDFDVIVDFHNPHKFHLRVPYTVSWKQGYLTALQELVTLFEYPRNYDEYIKFDDEYIFITDRSFLTRFKQRFLYNEKVLLTINSLHDNISINTCVQTVYESHVQRNHIPLYYNGFQGIKFMSSNVVDSYILFPIDENKLKRFQGSTEVSLSVSSAKNCPEIS